MHKFFVTTIRASLIIDILINSIKAVTKGAASHKYGVKAAFYYEGIMPLQMNSNSIYNLINDKQYLLSDEYKDHRCMWVIYVENEREFKDFISNEFMRLKKMDSGEYGELLKFCFITSMSCDHENF